MRERRAQRKAGDRKTAARFNRRGRRFWLFGGVGLALLIALATVVAIEFSASQKLPSKENPDLPGIDVVGLDADQFQMLLTRAKNERCPCTCGFTLAECRHKDRTCPLSGPILDGMVRDYRVQHRGTGPVE